VRASPEGCGGPQPDARYNRSMIAKTVHVFPSDGSWEVRREGKSGKMFVTRREAADAARETVKKDSAGQFVVHGKDGQIREHGAHRMTRYRTRTHLKRAAGQMTSRGL
jgi:hypothetical protein